uniref:Uncharacterized protein n=1 Tax=Tanacetum cinerariifolium TaxID=118510 RepID=A0A6L2LHC5_TANCI|nr:hypothetical protein [Tanacetum cinerariifolium]
MAALPICDELRRSVNSANWEPHFIYYCERAKLDDIRLARQINALCGTLTNVIDGRWTFVRELDMLTYKVMPGKMVEFMKKMQDKDILNLMKLQILGREFELRARENDLFIEKLNPDADDGVPIFLTWLDCSFVTTWLALFHELSRAADSHDIRDQLSVLFRMEVDDMDKASRLAVMAREIQDKVYENNTFIAKLRE